MELTNDFHGTSVIIRKSREDLERLEHVLASGHPQSPEYKAAKRYQRKVWGTLCGIKGCTCGNIWGER